MRRELRSGGEELAALGALEGAGFGDGGARNGAVLGAVEGAGGELAARQVTEEDLVRHQAGHCDHRPAGALEQARIELLEIGNAGVGEAQHVEPLLERTHRPPGEPRLLAGEEQVPDAVILSREVAPVLRDGPVVLLVPLGEFGEHAWSPDMKNPARRVRTGWKRLGL